MTFKLLFLLGFVHSKGISTHVLDTASGLPGKGVKIDVHWQDANVANAEWKLIKDTYVK